MIYAAAFISVALPLAALISVMAHFARKPPLPPVEPVRDWSQPADRLRVVYEEES